MQDQTVKLQTVIDTISAQARSAKTEGERRQLYELTTQLGHNLRTELGSTFNLEEFRRACDVPTEWKSAAA